MKWGSPFVDNAILQREMKVPVWGWSKPGTKSHGRVCRSEEDRYDRQGWQVDAPA